MVNDQQEGIPSLMFVLHSSEVKNNLEMSNIMFINLMNPKVQL